MYTNKKELTDLLINKPYELYTEEFREGIIDGCYYFSGLIEEINGKKLKTIEFGENSFEDFSTIEKLVLYYIGVLETYAILYFNNIIINTNTLKWEERH